MAGGQDNDVEKSLLSQDAADARPSRDHSEDVGTPILVNAAPTSESNSATAILILSKATVGAGIAALPLTDSLLGWPLATIFVLGMAYATYYTLQILIRCTNREGTPSYTEVTHKLLGRSSGIMLEVAVVAFGLGMMLVYIVIAGDMLVGKPGFKGLLCEYLGDQPHCGWTCSRPIITGLVTLLILIPLISSRRLESSAVASFAGMAAVGIWAVGTIVLVTVGAVHGLLQPIRLLPDRQLLGGSGWHLVTNICAIIPVLTTAYSVQASAPFVLAELRPQTPAAKARVSLYSLALTSVLFLLIAVGSYAVFGASVQSDVLHNFTPKHLEPFLGRTSGTALYVVVRLSFLVSVLSLFPIMMFPSRDGLLRLTTGKQSDDLSTGTFYLVTYGLAITLYLISIVTPSIWGPIQIIGATAGAVIGFIVPGMLSLLPTEASLMPGHDSSLDKVPGCVLIAIGALQGIAGIVSQLLAR